MEQIIGMCGIVCTTCPAHLATLNNDRAALAKLAQEWSNEQYPLQAEDMLCDGCSTTAERMITFCKDCTTRQCVLSRQIPNCAHCDEFPCDALEKHWQMAQAATAKALLMDIRKQYLTSQS